MTIRDKGIPKRKTCPGGRFEKVSQSFSATGAKLRALSFRFWSMYICDAVPDHDTIPKYS